MERRTIFLNLKNGMKFTFNDKCFVILSGMKDVFEILPFDNEKIFIPCLYYKDKEPEDKSFDIITLDEIRLNWTKVEVTKEIMKDKFFLPTYWIFVVNTSNPNNKKKKYETHITIQKSKKEGFDYFVMI